MRILWHSNAPWIKTGYGLQTALWVPRLAALGHEVIVSGPFSFAGSPMAWGQCTVLPGAQDPFGSDVIGGHYRRNQCDLLITLCDVFMMDPNALKGLNVVHWLPVDCERMGKMDADHARFSGVQIAMSRFGEKQMQAAGFSPFYVPHAVDTQEFSPPDDRKALRESMGFDPDDFLIGLNAANKDGPRKGIMEQVIAFADFHQRHPKSKMLIHSMAQPKQGLNIKDLADYMGITGAIMLPDQYSYACGLMDSATMARWYGILDVYSNCSYGEGFGIPIIEAQACGTPVVVTNASSMPELCGAGWKVNGEPFWVGGHNSMWTRPNITAITGAFENAYELYASPDGAGGPDGERVTMDDLRATARKFAEQYDADLVLERYWKPVLEEIDAKRPKTVRVTAGDRAELPDHVSEDDPRRDLLLVVPSRGRPASVERLIGAVAGTATMRTDIMFAFDDDDPDFPEASDIVRAAMDSGLPVGFTVSEERMGLADWTNKVAVPQAEHYRYLGSFGDDHCPQTVGWDAELLKVIDADGPGFAYPNDTVRDDIPQAVVVSSEIVRALGWMCEPTLKHYFVDNVWSDLGQYGGCISYLPDVIVEHVHHLKQPGKVEHDATYKNNETKFAADQLAYQQWRAERLAADVAVIRALREPALEGAAA